MNCVERVKKICKERKIPISRIEKDLGFANGYIGQLKKGTFPADRLNEIANYLNVSSEYLLTGETNGYYYLNPETAEVAQAVFDDPELKILFNAARDAKPEDIKLAAELLKRMKETNPDG